MYSSMKYEKYIYYARTSYVIPDNGYVKTFGFTNEMSDIKLPKYVLLRNENL